MTTNTIPVQPVPMTKADLVSDQQVRWCPGCGDYAILATVQRTLAQLAVKRENCENARKEIAQFQNRRLARMRTEDENGNQGWVNNTDLEPSR